MGWTDHLLGFFLGSPFPDHLLGFFPESLAPHGLCHFYSLFCSVSLQFASVSDLAAFLSHCQSLWKDPAKKKADTELVVCQLYWAFVPAYAHLPTMAATRTLQLGRHGRKGSFQFFLSTVSSFERWESWCVCWSKLSVQEGAGERIHWAECAHIHPAEVFSRLPQRYLSSSQAHTSIGGTASLFPALAIFLLSHAYILSAGTAACPAEVYKAIFLLQFSLYSFTISVDRSCQEAFRGLVMPQWDRLRLLFSFFPFYGYLLLICCNDVCVISLQLCFQHVEQTR